MVAEILIFLQIRWLYKYVILRSFKYRLYPTDEQKVLLGKHFGCVRFVYNWGLETKNKHYNESKKTISCIALINEMVASLKTQHEWLYEINAQSLQMALRNLDNAYTRFFRERKGFPKFKNKHGKQSFQCPQRCQVDFESRMITIPKIKNIKAVFDRKFEGKIKTATISKSPTGKYFVSILVETVSETKEKPKPNRNKAVGIDMGLKHFVTLSTGEKIENPKHLEKLSAKLSMLNRWKDRKKKGSNRREKTRLRLALLHEKIASQRNDFLHKLSIRLIRENQSICLEDLNIVGMMKNHTLSKSISSASWNKFVSMLKYKGEWYGCNIIQIGRFEPSSKMCSCGKINNNLTLKDRTWICNECGVEHDRDVLAANNIKDFAFHKQNLVRHRAGLARINAQGDDKFAEQQCSVIV